MTFLENCHPDQSTPSYREMDAEPCCSEMKKPGALDESAGFVKGKDSLGGAQAPVFCQRLRTKTLEISR